MDAQKLLIALSIPKCGPDVAKRLLVNYTLEQLMDLADNTKVGDGNEKTDETEVNMPATDVLSHIDGIGPERSALIIGWFKNEDNKLILRNLLNEVRVIHKQVKPTGKQCDGLTFVITGDVHHYKNRNELKAYIESQGGKVTGSVSNSTSFLINNDVTSTSGKNKKAQELGIPILSEDDFISRFGTAERTPEPEQLSLF